MNEGFRVIRNVNLFRLTTTERVKKGLNTIKNSMFGIAYIRWKEEQSESIMSWQRTLQVRLRF